MWNLKQIHTQTKTEKKINSNQKPNSDTENSSVVARSSKLGMEERGEVCFIVVVVVVFFLISINFNFKKKKGKKRNKGKFKWGYHHVRLLLCQP